LVKSDSKDFYIVRKILFFKSMLIFLFIVNPAPKKRKEAAQFSTLLIILMICTHTFPGTKTKNLQFDHFIYNLIS